MKVDNQETTSQQTEPRPYLYDLQAIREQLLAPREISRDAGGWLTHPAVPICAEGVRHDDLFAVFGIESAFVSMEADNGDLADQYFESEEANCSFWNPTPPAGEGWLLLEIYDTEDGPYALFGRAMPQEAWPRYGSPHFDLNAHLMRQMVFSFNTFGPGHRTQGVIDHIRKELREIEAEPHNVGEWIDAILLAFDGAWRAQLGQFERRLPREDMAIAARTIISALIAKQMKNEARQWSDWRTAPP